MNIIIYLYMMVSRLLWFPTWAPKIAVIKTIWGPYGAHMGPI